MPDPEPAGEIPDIAEDLDEIIDPESEAEADSTSILTSKNFPDSNLLNALRNMYSGGLTAEEAAGVNSLNFSAYKNIADCTGINAFFPNLVYLYFDGNDIKTLDVSSLTQLTTLNCLQSKSLTSISLPSSGSKLIELDIRGCSLSSIDLSGQTNLEVFYCVGSALRSIDVSGLYNLLKLYCNNCDLLTELNCEGCSSLIEVYASECIIEKINISGCDSMEYLEIYNNRIAYLDMSCLPYNAAYSAVNQTCPRTVNGFDFDGAVYFDLTAENLIPQGAEVSCADACFSDGHGTFIIPYDEYDFYFYHKISADITVKWPAPGGGYCDVSVSMDISINEELPFTVPEYVLLSKDNSDGVDLMVRYYDGTSLDYNALLSKGILWSINSLDLDISGGNVRALDCTAGYSYPIEYCIVFEASESDFPDHVLDSGNIRIDVVDGSISDPETGVTGVELLENSAVVDLYKTDYAQLHTLLELEQNLPENNASPNSLLPEEELADVEDIGYAIESAEFTGAAAEWFDLHPNGDRKLIIVPHYDKIEALNNGSIKLPKSITDKVQIALSDGSTFTTGNIKITPKATMPKVSVKAVTLNSWTGFENSNFAFFDYSAKNGENILSCDIVGDLPSWLVYEDTDDGLKLVYKGAFKGKYSYNAKLEFTVEGYAVKPQSSVKVTVKPTAPKVTMSAKTLTLKSSANDTAHFEIYAVMKHAYYGEISKIHDFNLLRLTEGSGKTLRIYAPEDILNIDSLQFEQGEYPYQTETLNISLKNPDGNKHVYKLYMFYAGDERCVTINVVPNSAKASLILKTVKGYESINLSGVPYAVFTYTGKNCGINSDSVFTVYDCYDWLKNYETNYYVIDSKKQIVDINKYNVYEEPGNVYLHADGLEPGKYTLFYGVDLYGTGGDNPDTCVWGSSAFSVKKLQESCKLSAKGNLEAYIYSEMDLTCSFTNEIFRYESPGILRNLLRIYKDKACQQDVTDKFDIHVMNDGRKGITPSNDERHLIITSNENTQPGTYYAKLSYKLSDVEINGVGNYDKSAIISSNLLKITVKGSTPKVMLNVNDTVVSSKDINDYIIVNLEEKSISGIEVYDNSDIHKITLDSKSLKYFNLSENPFSMKPGEYHLCWNSDIRSISAIKPGTTLTVKLTVPFKDHGGMSPKPATVSFKLKIQ